MKRKIYSKLLDWKNRWHGTTALLIDGARRVGKSWIAGEFGRNEYRTCLLIDFNNVSDDIIDLFEHYLTDLDAFFMRLSIFTNVRLYERETLIIFDEVQIYPRARAAIKYLVKDGRYDYIETGSLVSINHNVKDIVIPSEEMRVDMYPMDFEEFMWATGRDALFDFMRSQYERCKPMGQALHRQMMGALREYILVGGMPQAVESFIRDRDFRMVDAVKRNIIALYRNDIVKYAGRQAPKVMAIFDNIPGALQKHEKRFRPSQIQPGRRMRDFVDSMFWLDESRVAAFCYCATEPSAGLAMTRDDAKVKIYMADTGLLVSMAFSEADLEVEGVYEKILCGKLEFNKGMLTENLVAQMLTAAGYPLYFFSRYSRDNADERMEIDFLIRKRSVTSRHNIIPLEVKSSGNYRTTSLDRFRAKYANYLAAPCMLHTGDLAMDGDILYLPLYMACLL